MKAAAERRLERGLLPLLDLLDRHHTRGTFYVLGPVAREHPDLCAEIARRGHELGCHGWSHDLLTYRAAYFSVTKASWWALEELAGLGFHTDSSIFPVSRGARSR